MLQRVHVDGIEFPRLYIAENNIDVQLARDNGIPYIKWRHGMDQLVRCLLRPVLEQLFPGIKWNDVLGRKKPVRSDVVIVHGCKHEGEIDVAEYDAEEMLESQHEYDNVVDELDHNWQLPDENGEYVRQVDIAESPRDCIADRSSWSYQEFTEDRLSVSDYIGDISSSVDIMALNKLGLLPKFVGDITDCIASNRSQSMRWTEGYTKKLGVPLGKFNYKRELPNLVIIDCSYSIPDGIAATMLVLADMLRSMLNAELIITSRRSGWYPVGAELPKPQTLRDYYGRSNESAEFMGILRDHIAGREFGYVISFGDHDNPGRIWDAGLDMKGTIVHEVQHYHTNRHSWYGNELETGYARWCKECCPTVKEFFDTSWCKVMNTRYHMD